MASPADAISSSASSNSASRSALNGSAAKGHTASPSQVNLGSLAAKRTPDTAGGPNVRFLAAISVLSWLTSSTCRLNIASQNILLALWWRLSL